MSNIVFLAERWPFAGPSTNRWPHNLLKNKYLLIMWRSLSPAKSQNSTVPLRNLLGWLDLSAFPAGFGIARPEAAKACGSFFDSRNPRVNRSYMLFLVLASFVFAMLSSGEIANFVMRSNNPIDSCPNEHVGASRRLLVVADRNGARELRLSWRAAFRPGNGPPCSSTLRLPLATAFSFTS